MFYKNLITLLILLLCNNIFAQKQDYNWCFADSVGINFNSGITVFNSSINSSEPAATISDKNGNLLFYSGSPDDGSTGTWGYYQIYVWDSTHNMMQNGDSIYGSSTVTQGCLIIPFVNDTNLFYLFTISYPQNQFIHKLYYSIIDKSLRAV